MMVSRWGISLIFNLKINNKKKLYKRIQHTCSHYTCTAHMFTIQCIIHMYNTNVHNTMYNTCSQYNVLYTCSQYTCTTHMYNTDVHNTQV